MTRDARIANYTGDHRLVKAFASRNYGVKSDVVPTESSEARRRDGLTQCEFTPTTDYLLVWPANSPVTFLFDMNSGVPVFSGTSSVANILSNSGIDYAQRLGFNATFSNDTARQDQNGHLYWGIAHELPPIAEAGTYWNAADIQEAMSDEGEMTRVQMTDLENFTAPIPATAKDSWSDNPSLGLQVDSTATPRQFTMDTYLYASTASTYHDFGATGEDSNAICAFKTFSTTRANIMTATGYASSRIPITLDLPVLNGRFNFNLSAVTAASELVTYLVAVFATGDAITPIITAQVPLQTYSNPGTTAAIQGNFTVDTELLALQLKASGYLIAPPIFLGCELQVINITTPGDLFAFVNAPNPVFNDRFDLSVVYKTYYTTHRHASCFYFENTNDAIKMKAEGEILFVPNQEGSVLAGDPCDPLTPETANKVALYSDTARRHRKSELMTYSLVPKEVGAFSLGDILRGGFRLLGKAGLGFIKGFVGSGGSVKGGALGAVNSVFSYRDPLPVEVSCSPSDMDLDLEMVPDPVPLDWTDLPPLRWLDGLEPPPLVRSTVHASPTMPDELAPIRLTLADGTIECTVSQFPIVLRSLREVRCAPERKTKELQVPEEKKVNPMTVRSPSIPDGEYVLDPPIMLNGKLATRVTKRGREIRWGSEVKSNSAIYAAGVADGKAVPIEIIEYDPQPADDAVVYRVGQHEVYVCVKELHEGVLTNLPVPSSFSSVFDTMNQLAKTRPEMFPGVTGLMYAVEDGFLSDQFSPSVCAATFVALTRGIGGAYSGVSGFREGTDLLGLPLPDLGVGGLHWKSKIEGKLGISKLVAMSQTAQKGVVSVQSYAQLYAATHVEPPWAASLLSLRQSSLPGSVEAGRKGRTQLVWVPKGTVPKKMAVEKKSKRSSNNLPSLAKLLNRSATLARRSPQLLTAVAKLITPKLQRGLQNLFVRQRKKSS